MSADSTGAQSTTDLADSRAGPLEDPAGSVLFFVLHAHREHAQQVDRQQQAQRGDPDEVQARRLAQHRG